MFIKSYYIIFKAEHSSHHTDRHIHLFSLNSTGSHYNALRNVKFLNKTYIINYKKYIYLTETQTFTCSNTESNTHDYTTKLSYTTYKETIHSCVIYISII